MDQKLRKFIVYGAGRQGKWCLDFLEWRKMSDRLHAFCDKQSGKIGNIVLSYQEALNENMPFLVSCADTMMADEILQKIKSDGGEGYGFDEFYMLLGEEQSVFLREWCAYHHARNNDLWFEEAEKQEAKGVFWNKDSVFYQYFKELDLQNVIELACGRGRHVPYYMEKAERITLVDILEENMVFCRERFAGKEHIIYYQNNGYNLEELPSDSYTAMFTYDSMVHFEMMDIYEYLKDIYRVLKKGGKALLHHSNYSVDYKADFAHTSHARCFMSKDIFAYLAHRAGFKILDQKVIDWSHNKDLDCITLLEK